MNENIEDVSNLDDFLENAANAGFQAGELGQARSVLRQIVATKLGGGKRAAAKEEFAVYLGFTANLVASGMRGYIARLVGSGLVDAVVTTPGAIEHDMIKCFKPYLRGDFELDDAALHKKGINRIGNILVPNDRYVLFEKLFGEITGNAVKKYGNMISPSEFTHEAGGYLAEKLGGSSKVGKGKMNSGGSGGKHRDNSFLVCAFENNIPVFCPGITDGAIGLQTYFYKQRNRGFGIDVTKDMKALADITLNADKTAAIVLGGGISKHHIIGVNIMRGGLDYAIYLTTAAEWDGSMSGAKTREAISWGKIKEKATHAYVYGDATINLPLLMHKIV